MIKYLIKKQLLFFVFCFIASKIFAQSVGGTTSGGSTYCDTINDGFVSLIPFSYNGAILYWESSEDSVVWTKDLTATTPVQGYANLKTTTWFRAAVQDGTFPPDTSIPTKLIIYPASNGGTVGGGGIFCGGTGAGTLSLTGYLGNILHWQYSINNGLTWTPVVNTTATLVYPNLTQNTLYRAVAQSNIACPADTSSSATFVFSPSIGGTISGGGTFCEGSGIGTLNLTGQIGTILNWQYSINDGASWTTINNTTSQLNYTNITQKTMYEAVVRLGSTCVPDSSSRVTFVFDPTVPGISSGDKTVCSGLNAGTITLTGNVGEVQGWLQSTNNGDTWESIDTVTSSLNYSNLTKTTWYKAIVKHGSCEGMLSNHVVIIVNPKPLVNAGNDTAIFSGESIRLNGSGSGVYSWTPSINIDSTTILKPLITLENTAMYKLTITDSNTCVNSDSVLITVNIKEFSGVVSNLFTPNGDGINDAWFVKDIQNFPDNEVFVYNIYGNLVYSKKGYINDWQGTYNGSPLPDGTYYYVIRFDSSDKVFKGSLDIL